MNRIDILRAIIKGEHDVMRLVKRRHCTCKKSEAEIAKALQGNDREDF